MIRLAGLKRAGEIALGYAVAVLVAVAVTEALMLAPSILPDQGRFGSFFDSLRSLPNLFGAGLLYTFTFGLPGFLLVVLIAWRLRWRRWLIFAICGAANAVLALVLFTFSMDGRLSDVSWLALYCVPGGFAGGMAYWRIAVAKRIGAERP